MRIRRTVYTIAAVGWMALGAWFVFFEGLGWLLQGWTLSQQWWQWMDAIPRWLAWTFFVGYQALGVHLWWVLFRKN